MTRRPLRIVRFATVLLALAGAGGRPAATEKPASPDRGDVREGVQRGDEGGVPNGGISDGDDWLG